MKGGQWVWLALRIETEGGFVNLGGSSQKEDGGVGFCVFVSFVTSCDWGVGSGELRSC